MDKQDRDLLEIVNRSSSSYPVSIGNFVQILHPHWKFIFMTPNRVNLLVKTCVKLKVPPESFKQTVSCVRSELTPLGFPNLRGKHSPFIADCPKLNLI